MNGFTVKTCKADRGHGYGGALLRACHRRWPNLTATDRLEKMESRPRCEAVADA